MNIQYFSYWGKAEKDTTIWHPLVYHCLDVAAVLKIYLANNSLLTKRIADLYQGDFKGIEPWLLYFSALHDLGKFARPFQSKREDIVQLIGGNSGSSSNIHHTEHGMWLFREYIEYSEDPDLGDNIEYIIEPLQTAAFGHHGCPVGVNEKISRDHFEKSKEDAFLYCSDVWKLFAPDIEALYDLEDDALISLGWLFAGCMVVADWIGSNSLWFRPFTEQVSLADYYQNIALPQAGRAVKECGLLGPQPADNMDFYSLFEHLKNFSPSALQRYGLEEAVRTQGPQLHIFEDLTGGGKTEAAIGCCARLLQNGSASGMYIGLPTTATANAMYQRMVKSYRNLFKETEYPSLMLAHSARHINDDFLSSIDMEKSGNIDDIDDEGSAHCTSWLAQGRKKSLLAPCGAGTLDQALLAVLPVKHQCLRILGCVQNTLVADEVHSYDTYTTRLLCGLIKFQTALGGSLVLLSATITNKLRSELIASFCDGAGFLAPELEDKSFPLATSIDFQGLREVPISSTRIIQADVCLTQDVSEIYSGLLEVREAGGCCLWVRNTVDQAREAYDALLLKEVPEDDILLFHARFTQLDRQSIEGKALQWLGKESSSEQRKGKIIISTQVCESSLDIDADFIVSDLAPMDSILQRLGRSHRHKRQRPKGFENCKLFIFSPDPADDVPRGWYEGLLGKAKWVYRCSAVLWRTARLLKDTGRIELIPDENGNIAEIRRLMEGAYGQLDAPQTMLQDEEYFIGEEMGARSLAGSNILDFDSGYFSGPAWYEDTITPTRNGEDTVQLRLLKIVNEEPQLWAGDIFSAKNCALSEMRVNRRKLEKLGKPVLSKEVEKQIENMKEKFPDKGRWCEVLPVILTGEIWNCEMENGVIRYSPVRGMEVEFS